MTDTLNLRPLQDRFIAELRGALKESRKVLGVAPCGFGKRYILTWLAMRCAERGKRFFAATNRRVLVEQLTDECRRHGITVGTIMADDPRNDSALVQVASLQTLKARGWKGLPEADLICVDEGHNDVASYHKLFETYPTSKVVAVTATPVGPSGKSLVGLYDRIVEPVRNTELIEGKWLLKTRVIAPSEPDVQAVFIDKKGKERKGVDVLGGKEFSQEQLADVVEQCTVFADVFRWWEPYSDMSTLCIVPRVKYAYGIAQQFRERGFSAEVIEGATTTKARHEVFNKFNAGEVRVIVGVDVPKEGLDLPCAQLGIDLQPNFQFRNWWQKLGRVRRPYGEQTEAIWLDFSGNLWRHGIHPDEDVPWDQIVDDRSTADVLAERSGRKCKKCGSRNIRKGRCDDCGAEVGEVKKPWERLTNGQCPGCGAKVGKPTRKIRMKNGEMRVVAADELKTKKRSKATSEQKAWDACRYRAMNCGKTMDFARWLYRRDTGNWPSEKTLKCCPEPKSADWKCKPADVYPWMKRRTEE